MNKTHHLRLAPAALVLLFLAGPAPAQVRDPKVVEFNRHIRPILSENCFQCHGPDKNQRKGDLRLDTEQGALEDRGGYRVIVEGKPDESELLKRITRTEKAGRMPPVKTGKHLSAQQVELIRRWVAQGGKYEKHWSLIPPRRRPVPTIKGQRPDNPIDAFVRMRQELHGLRPSPETDRRTLARRLSFDLLGLPPSPEEVDAFIRDTSPQAYEKHVDRLLASQHFGERLAIYWLDVVRFADTNGIHGDNHREIAPYRDYVIDSFNANKPFDRFITEQLAGDLLPGATSEQKIGSGFNKLLMTTREGGAQAKEYLAKYSADRVRNTATALLGITLGCCECHDHKFDPFTQRDFYSFAAFFADIKDVPVGVQPTTRLPTAEQEKEIRRIDGHLTALHARLEGPVPGLADSQALWEADARTRLQDGQLDWITLKPEKAVSSGKATLTVQPDLSVLSTGKNPKKDTYTVTLRTDQKGITGLRLEALGHPSFGNPGLSRGNGNFVLTEFEVTLGSKGGRATRPVKIASATADYQQGGFPVAQAIDGNRATGWAIEGHAKGGDRTAVFTLAEPIPGGPGTTLIVRLRHESQYAQHNIGRFRLSATTVAKPTLTAKGGLPGAVVQALKVEPGKRSPAQKQVLANWFRGIAPQLQPLRKEMAELQKQRDAILKAEPETLISLSGSPRTIRMLPRGNWLDESGPVVEPQTPASLSPLSVKDRRASRLDLARWMTSADNPLTARVFVNRLWKLFYGQGLVKTLDDFGAQGNWPTHPDLLDWLAVEFRESGWDVKHLIKLMVMSETYRQTSRPTEALVKADPYNQWLARQGRFRLDAEMVRDNALAVSGLLVQKIGGRSVKPYQPAGYWAHLNFPRREWQKDAGDAVYRRGVYTYWCRTFLHPSLLAFDAPSREECCVERARSNTPQQALVLLNDPTYVEAARALAEKIVRSGGKTSGDRIRFAFRQVLQRQPLPAESKLLTVLAERHLTDYRKDTAAAQELVKVGDRPVPQGMDLPELAAWTSVSRVLLNLHETITRN
jgi:mono/diheme cytochrome c family protein